MAGSITLGRGSSGGSGGRGDRTPQPTLSGRLSIGNYARQSRRRFFLVIPLRLPAPVRPPSSFRRKPESRGHLSPRSRLSPGRRMRAPGDEGAPRRKSISSLWIPACAGMTTGWDLQVCNSQSKALLIRGVGGFALRSERIANRGTPHARLRLSFSGVFPIFRSSGDSHGAH